MNEGDTNTAAGQPRKANPRRSLEEATSELDREIKVRARCYDRWVAEGKLSRIDAVDRMERMQAALAYLNERLELTDVVVPPGRADTF